METRSSKGRDSMGAAHTPGPWLVEKGADGVSLWVGCPRYTVAMISGVGNRVNIGESDANAILIGAAPDLLAALQELQANPNDPRAHRKALDAIAKATRSMT